MKRGIIVTSLIVSTLLAGCGQNKQEVVNQQVKVETEENQQNSIEEADKKEEVAQREIDNNKEETKEEINEEPAVVPVFTLKDGEVFNPLTGMPMSAELKTKRPVAVTINNIKAALPQSGIAKADVIYEVLAEGGITRLVAVFQDTAGIEKLGPIRSARRYFLDIALDQDAVYLHFGNDPSIWRDFNGLGIANLNGMNGTLDYWRSKDRRAPHNVYTDTVLIKRAWSRVGYRTNRKEDYAYLYGYSEVEQVFEAGQVAIDVKIPYSPYITGRFVYNDETSLYARYQFGDKQIDKNTDEQLMAKNIIIQFSNVRRRPGDNAGRLDIDMIGEGKGYYVSNGQQIPITWKKASQYSPTTYALTTGEQLKINPGKTWICIAPKETKVTFE